MGVDYPWREVVRSRDRLEQPGRLPSSVRAYGENTDDYERKVLAARGFKLPQSGADRQPCTAGSKTRAKRSSTKVGHGGGILGCTQEAALVDAAGATGAGSGVGTCADCHPPTMAEKCAGRMGV